MLLRAANLRVTGPRVAVMELLAERPHVSAEAIIRELRARSSAVSHQAVYDVLAALTGARLVRRIEPAGHSPLYERRTGDNHHHVVCRVCHRVEDVDCAVGHTPCLSASDDLGFELDEAEADHLAGADGDHHRRDLWEAINRGEHPTWSLKVQVMPFEDAPNYRFNPFDLTKVWPHGDYPLIDIGTLTLDRNPENFFAEIEQSAFEPSIMVPRTMINEVWDDAARDRFVGNVSGHLRNGVSEPVLQRALEYWRAVDAEIGKRIETAVRGA